MELNLSDIVCDSFHEIFSDIVNCEIDRAVLKGGRSSTKSQVASEAILVGCMVHRQSAVCLLKHANKIEERLVNTFKSSIEYLNIGKYWKLRKSPFEYVLLDDHGKETEISIKFTGCDNPEMIKSYKPRLGSFRYIWFEELTNFSNLKEVNNIIETMARGDGKHTVIMTYNPPIRFSSWVNKEYDAPCGKVLGHNSNSHREEIDVEYDGGVEKIVQVVHHSTYLDVIESGHSNWLGKTFIGEASKAKENNNKYYRWAYLGEIVGTDANVFNNIHSWNYEDKGFSKINRGLDVSNGGKDPWAYVEWYYDKNNKDLYCLAESRIEGSASLDLVTMRIKQINDKGREIFIDSAVPTFGSILRTNGLNIIPAIKGKDSVIAGVEWLRSLNHIYIDKYKTPETYKEFSAYEWFIDKNDEITSKLVDENNHFIDSTRYAMNIEIKY